MNKYRYNNANERCKRVNRVFILAVYILFAVLGIYHCLLFSADTLSTPLFICGLVLLVVFSVLHTTTYFLNRASAHLKYFITFEVAILFVFFALCFVILHFAIQAILYCHFFTKHLQRYNFYDYFSLYTTKYFGAYWFFISICNAFRIA